MSATSALSKLKPRYVALGIILLIAAIRRFSLPSVPFADGDLYGYLLPAVRLLEDHTLSHEGTRSFVYPLFISVLMKIWGSVTIVAFVQHLIGLLTGFFIFQIFEQPIFRALKTGKLAKLITAVQLGCTAYYLLASSIFQYEHFITSQAICTFILTTQLLLLATLVGNKATEKANLRRGSAIIFLALLTFILTPKLGFALPLIGLIVFIEFYLRGIHVKRWILPVALPTVIFFALLWLPETYLARKYDPYKFVFPFKQFFYSHADMAKNLIESDIAYNQTQYPTDLLKQVNDIMVLPNAPHQNFKYLGFDVDTMLIGGYDTKLVELLNSYGYNSLSFQKQYNIRILKELPGKYALKIADQVQHYYIGADGYDRLLVGEFVELYNVQEMTLEVTHRPEMSNWDLTRDYQFLANQQLTNWHWVSNFSILAVIGLILKFFYVHTIIIMALLCAFVYLKKKATPNTYSPMLRFLLYLALIQFSLVLTVAVIHTFDYHRYAAWFFPTEIILFGSAIIIIATNVRALRYR